VSPQLAKYILVGLELPPFQRSREAELSPLQGAQFKSTTSEKRPGKSGVASIPKEPKARP
jgi:hypothetical protein